MDVTAIRELPVGARQQAHILCIPLEQRTELTVGCAGRTRYSAYECRKLFRNKSGTAEVIMPLSLS